MKPSNQKTPYAGEKIVLASAMAAHEKKLIDKDPSLSEKFMDIAALGLYQILSQKVLDINNFSRVVLLIGKGNNGGDAYALGSLLLRSGIDVIAYQVYEDVSELSAKKGDVFEKNDGERIFLKHLDEIELSDNDLIIDGLLGTGFKGHISGPLEGVIERCNRSKGFVFSIDIPSGVDGDTGAVGGCAVKADMTAYLGALKVGHFFEQGFLYVGSLQYVDFGMNIDDLQAESYLVNPSVFNQYLPKRKRLDHKYDIGEVCVVAGSDEMHGAAELSCKAAYRAGCGLVRHFFLGNQRLKMDEVISSELNLETFEGKILKSKAYLIGPGLGRSDKSRLAVEKVMNLKDLPGVIDADAFYLLDKPQAGAILTPHKGELINLLKLDKAVSEVELHAKAKEYCQTHKVTIIYKGVPTVIFSPNEDTLVTLSGNPGMATGGSGDVLSGIIASFLAQGLSSLDASVLGVLMHGKAGNAAAQKLSPQYMLASDIISELSSIFLEQD